MSEIPHDIKDDEIRIITSGNNADSPQKQTPRKRRSLIVVIYIVAAIICIAAICCIVFGNTANGSPVDLESETDKVVAENEKVKNEATESIIPEYTGAGFVSLSDTVVNKVGLSIFKPINLSPTLQIGTEVLDDSTARFVVQAADVRGDNGGIVGAYVNKGELISKGQAKSGFCAIIGGKINIGVADATPFLEQALEADGYFFRQYPLVVANQIVENKPKGKSLRKALAELDGEPVVIMSREGMTFHDFSQSLVDLGVTNAIYLVGSNVYGFAVGEDGTKIEFGGTIAGDASEYELYRLALTDRFDFIHQNKVLYNTRQNPLPGEMFERNLLHKTISDMKLNVLTFKRISAYSVIIALSAAITAILFSSCNRGESSEVSTNAIYFWKSWVNLSDAEQNFLTQNNVDKVYLRFFDIRDDFRFGPVPDAEVGTDRTDFPDGTEIVPCVFITLEAIEGMSGREKEFAMKIFERIDAKCKNGDLSFDEIQLDCDWTEYTRNTFFTLCKELKALTSAHDKKLSATIRLHQLSQPSPDVDKGVLMVYNVGELKNHKETNSILRSDIVKKYLDSAPEYSLPLDVAYPVFSWGVVFNGTEFNRLTKIDTEPDSIPELIRLHDNIFTLQSNISEDVNLDYRQTVRYEMASFDELIKTKQLVEEYLGYKPRNTILYHLDENQLSKYTPAQIKKIYE